MYIPLPTGSSEQQILTLQAKEQAPQECSPATHANDLDSGPPARPPQSLNTKEARKSKPSLCTQSHKEKREAEKTHRDAKRIRRT